MLAIAAYGWSAMFLHAVRPVHGGHPGSVFDGLARWMSMVAFMGLPTLVAPARQVAFRSFRHARHPSIAFLLLGYGAAWLLAGVPVAFLEATALVGSPLAVALAFAAAAAWTRTPRRVRALSACHALRPTNAYGWRGAIDVAALGVVLGGRCLLVCGPLMFACALTGHSLPVMLVCAGVSAAERSTFRPRTSLVTAGALALAAGYAISAALGGPAPLP